jgi:hypothetical protein
MMPTFRPPKAQGRYSFLAWVAVLFLVVNGRHVLGLDDLRG